MWKLTRFKYKFTVKVNMIEVDTVVEVNTVEKLTRLLLR